MSSASGDNRKDWGSVNEADVINLLSSVSKRSPWIVKWQTLSGFVHPYEWDWRAYTDTRRYPGPAPVTLEVHPYLGKHGNRIKMQEGLLKLGFIPQSECKFVLDQVQAQERLDLLRDRRQRMMLAKKRKEKQHVTWHIPSEASVSVTHDDESLLSVSAEGASYCGTSTASGGDGDASELASDTAELLKEQVRELTLQVRMLRAASLATPITKPVKPVIVNRNYCSPTTGNYPVRLQVNFLNPDAAPFRVAIQLSSIKGSGWGSPPCSVLDHQYVVFLAPPNPPGSYPVTLFGTTSTGELKKYCPSTWLEYRVIEDTESQSDSAIPRSSSIPSPRMKQASEIQSCIKGTRVKAKPDRRGSIASAGSSLKKEQQQSPVAHNLNSSGTQQHRGLTHHQMNEHNAMNIMPLCHIDPSEGPDTFDPTSDLKSHSEMKSEFTSDIAEEETRDDDDDEVWATRQFRALLPSTEVLDTEHPPLTKEMLEMLTLGQYFGTCTKSDVVRSLSAKSVNFANRASKGSVGGTGTTSLRSNSPVYGGGGATLAETSSVRSGKTLQVPPPNRWKVHNSMSSSGSSTSIKDAKPPASTSSAIAGMDSFECTESNPATPPLSTPPSSNSPIAHCRRTKSKAHASSSTPSKK
eukprot:TRINITY_DN3852_c0_g2_i1.p1 TRINITY_DN3852_c0_g2~~TRINITY_DN3852_c0_g2_i1.p1  ORF type:complete len:635 (+),score=93.08 TRINITY_DN3852_c0_g2_i1:57-1961(+)